MFVFLKLYLAHLVGDFVLQFEGLYQLKLKSRLGYVLHVILHAVLMLLFLFPYLSEASIWVFVLVVCTIHFYQDTLKYEWTNNPRFRFPLFVGDQVFHFLFLSTILLLPVSKEIRGFPEHALLDLLYRGNTLTLIAIALLVATFCGSYLFHAFYMNYRSPSRPDQFITRFEMAHGIIERSLVLFVFLFATSPIVFLSSFAVGILRLPFKTLRHRNDFLVSFVYAALVALFFRFLMIRYGV